jgi:glycosyltransferase involved in cell wall biosynthesis/SAM-dependent methyltransferase
MSVQICTIIARNYLPAARVLAASFLEHHPDGRVSTLVIDDLYGEVDAASEPFEVLRPDEIGIETEEFHRMAMIYGVLELATAVKPWLIQHLLSRAGADAVVYLDPDIRVYAPLDEVGTLAQEHGIVLTPHVTAAMPRDGKGVDETAILSAGIYNPGFIAVGQGSQSFLDFWKERVHRECQIDVQNMRFVDQRWLDFAPGVFDCHVLRDTSYNVAYWNLYQRDLHWTGEGYRVDGQPLKFFHFSGFDVNHPSLLSKHQGPHPRVLLSELPDVARICSEYVVAMRASTREKDADAAYGFAQLPNGLPIDREIRSLYRERLVHAEHDGLALPADPFSANGAEELATWLTSPPEGDSHRLSRYLSALRGSRRDLQAAFPDPDGADYDACFSWSQGEAVAGRLSPRLVPLVRLPRRSAPAAPAWALATELRPGICVAGYLRAELGVGQLGRLVLAAAEQADIEAGSLVFAETISRQQHPFEEIPATDLNVNIVAVNADQFVNFANDVGSAFFEGRYTIGVWAWELEEFPETWSQSFSLVDEVWAISEFSRRAIAVATEKPVLAFALPVVAPRPRPELDRALLGLPDGFLFLFCFDLCSVSERKNPRGLIQAFTAAFASGEGPMLVLKAINGEHRLADLEALKLLAAERPDIVVIDRYFDHDENAALMAACDCYVSLHRSEGFGLTMAEAMALGKPVIATAYSGNLDFMDDQTAYLVPCTEGSVPEGCAPYRAGARWAEPDLDTAARLMRRVVQHPDEAAAVGVRAQHAVLTKHGLAASADLLRARFEYAQGVLSARAEAGIADGEAGVTSAAGALPGGDSVLDDTSQSLVDVARSRADIGSPSRFPAISRPLRRAVARLTAHGDAHRAEVDARLAQSVLALEARVTEASLDSSALEARVTGASLDSRGQSILASQSAVRVARLDARLQAFVLASQTAARVAGVPTRIEALEAQLRQIDEAGVPTRIEALEAQLLQIDTELRAAPYMSDPSLLQTTDTQGRPAIGYRGLGSDGNSNGYAGFEDIFRGPQDFIRERMRPYLDLVRTHEPIVDIGCGRGEFLDLLAGEGIHAMGVDLDPGMVDICRGKGYEVAASDALDYLGALEDGSLGTVFSAQFIEHLSPADIVEYLRGAQRVLRGDGIFIAETVNPHSIQAFKTFWTDLTHRAPIFPEVAVALCRQAGFERALVVFPSGNGDLEHDRRSAGEYAVVAWKGKPVKRSGSHRAGKPRAVPSVIVPAAPVS